MSGLLEWKQLHKNLTRRCQQREAKFSKFSTWDMADDETLAGRASCAARIYIKRGEAEILGNDCENGNGHRQTINNRTPSRPKHGSPKKPSLPYRERCPSPGGIDLPFSKFDETESTEVHLKPKPSHQLL